VSTGRIAAALIVVVALAAACDDGGGGGSTSTTDKDATTDVAEEDLSTGGVPTGDGRLTACDLFSTDDAEALLGGPVSVSVDIDGAQASTCEYVLEDDATIALGVGVGTFDNTEAAEDAYLMARANAQFDELDPQDVDNLGDEAYWIADTTNFTREIAGEMLTLGELNVRDGTTLVTVYLTPPEQNTAEQAAEIAIS
jgi:hypothetical protein